MSLCVLAIIESRRRLRFPENFLQLPLFEQVESAQQRVRDHMKETEGHLPIWGTIQRYRFFFNEGCSIELAVDGGIVGERIGYEPDSAVMHLRGRQVNPEKLSTSKE